MAESTSFVDVKGIKKVEKMLIDLGKVNGFKALRSGLMAASKPMFTLAKANAMSTGLKGYGSEAMAAAMSRGTKKETAHRTTLWIGPRNKSKKALAIYNSHHGTEHDRLNYFHLVEWGSVHGPAQPFMRPAFAATAPALVNSLAGEIKKAVNKIRRKYAS